MTSGNSSQSHNSTSLKTDDADFSGYTEAIAQATKCLKVLRLYAAPALTAACLVGSCLILGSAIKRHRSLKPKYYVLVLLTMADCVTILSSAFFNQFLHYGLNIRMPHIASNSVCKFWSFVWITANSMSANLLCFLAIDRLYAVAQPLRHRAAMSRGRYGLLLAAFCAPLVAAGAFGVGTFETYEYLGQKHCYIAIDLPKWLGVSYQAYTTLVANGLIGSCLLLVANAILACRICSAARARSRYRTAEAAAAPADCAGGSGGEIPRKDRGNSSVAGATAGAAAVRTGVTLMAASAAHLLGSLPRAYCYLIAGIIEYGDLASGSLRTGQLLQLVFQLGSCFDYLVYANCSLNWLIYCANVPDLRAWQFEWRSSPNRRLSNCAR